MLPVMAQVEDVASDVVDFSKCTTEHTAQAMYCKSRMAMESSCSSTLRTSQGRISPHRVINFHNLPKQFASLANSGVRQTVESSAVGGPAQADPVTLLRLAALKAEAEEVVQPPRSSWMATLQPHIDHYVATYGASGSPSLERAGTIDLLLERAMKAMLQKDARMGRDAVQSLLSFLRGSPSQSQPQSLDSGRCSNKTRDVDKETQTFADTTPPATPLSPGVEEVASTLPSAHNGQSSEHGSLVKERELRPHRVGHGGLPDLNEDESKILSSIFVRRLKRVRKEKHYQDPMPSRHCHICARSASFVQLAVCGNLRKGICRKTTCEKCFQEFGWDWSSANDPSKNWLCTHCSKTCPDRAQCVIYKRTNDRRRESGPNRAPKKSKHEPSVTP
eukprot:CAMPEP_0184678912 /NCGR_PEP_ID=MMETSP0312-20130426/1738_1 /TAXON_ID=31354 /ORGANISM="Compsopogon coeruleus, Strain SAG 36.94" /LENGTH=389 /DNA_ID=CAMNT_0027128023 /DNA_START=221 /DNA_END=1390 /DNA_ORIENTATION=-